MVLSISALYVSCHFHKSSHAAIIYIRERSDQMTLEKFHVHPREFCNPNRTLRNRAITRKLISFSDRSSNMIAVKNNSEKDKFSAALGLNSDLEE
jgi:hypothetical protein